MLYHVRWLLNRQCFVGLQPIKCQFGHHVCHAASGNVCMPSQKRCPLVRFACSSGTHLCHPPSGSSVCLPNSVGCSAWRPPPQLTNSPAQSFPPHGGGLDVFRMSLIKKTARLPLLTHTVWRNSQLAAAKAEEKHLTAEACPSSGGKTMHWCPSSGGGLCVLQGEQCPMIPTRMLCPASVFLRRLVCIFVSYLRVACAAGKHLCRIEGQWLCKKDTEGCPMATLPPSFFPSGVPTRPPTPLPSANPSTATPSTCRPPLSFTSSKSVAP